MATDFKPPHPFGCAEDAREHLFPDTPENLPIEEREAIWIADYVKERDRRRRRFFESAGFSEAEANHFLDWNSPNASEKLNRIAHRQAAEQCRAARENLTRLLDCFNDDFFLRMGPPEESGESTVCSVDADVEAAFRVIDEKLKRKEKSYQVTGRWSNLEGNFATNRSARVFECWLALEAENYSMRAASRIMARGFELAGKEEGSAEKRAASIYQVIRDSSR